MAQANSVQREPSMEEILASIRRIIEDSDTVRKHVDDDEDMAAPADIEAELQAVEVEAFRGELSTAAVNAFPRPASMAQIQAEAEQAPRVEPAERESWPQAFAPPQPEAEREDEPAPDVELDETDFSAAADEEAEAPVHAENQNPRPAILSDHAGRQVAASFGELSEAFAASRRKSFDEMAEDMMRPMLQDWLDNNLPLLVERLVREEIERVARGGAR